MSLSKDSLKQYISCLKNPRRNYHIFHKLCQQENPEYYRYLDDFQHHPLWEPHKSVYKDVEYSIKRTNLSHLWGYITSEEMEMFTPEEIRIIENQSCHREFNNTFGFDCAHYDDYCPIPFAKFQPNIRATYKNFDFVEGVIKRIIDHMYVLRFDMFGSNLDRN